MPDDTGVEGALPLAQRKFRGSDRISEACPRRKSKTTRWVTIHQYPTINANTEPERELKADHTELLRRYVSYNIRRCENPATARGLLSRDGWGGMWECKVEHVLTLNARFSFQERGQDVHVRVDCTREREDPVATSIIVTQTQDLVYLTSLLFPLLHISLAQRAVCGSSPPGPLRLSACNRTVACPTLDWELHFSSTAGVESGFEGVEPMVVGKEREKQAT